MKRYWLFICDTYYPRGGMNDFRSDFDSIEEAVENAENLKREFGNGVWYHIFDTETRHRVASAGTIRIDDRTEVYNDNGDKIWPE